MWPWLTKILTQKLLMLLMLRIMQIDAFGNIAIATANSLKPAWKHHFHSLETNLNCLSQLRVSLLIACCMYLSKSIQSMGPLCVWQYFSNDQPLLRPARLLQHELAFELSHCQRVWNVISTGLRKIETTAFGTAESKMDVYIFSLQENKSSNP